MGSHSNAAKFYDTMLFCYKILPLKLDVPWGHLMSGKDFHGFSLIIASKA